MSYVTNMYLAFCVIPFELLIFVDLLPIRTVTSTYVTLLPQRVMPKGAFLQTIEGINNTELRHNPRTVTAYSHC